MSEYVTEAELLAVLPDATAADTAALEAIRTRASAVVDRYAGRRFESASVTPSARTFYGSGTHLLPIDWHEDALVTVATLPTGYTAPTFIERRNQDTESCYLSTTDAVGSLYTGMNTNFGTYATWPAGVAVSVTAAWGYAAVPEDIQQATLELCQAMWRETYAAALSADGWTGTVGLAFEITPRAKDILNTRRMTHAFRSMSFR